MQLAEESLFIDLVSQVADTRFGGDLFPGEGAGQPADPEMVRVECLTGWDQAYIHLCHARDGRPRSQLVHSPDVGHIQRRLGFPCWLLTQEGEETALNQFNRLQGWPHLVLSAIKVNPVAMALGGMRAVEAAVRLIRCKAPDPSNPPVCALTRGSNQIIAFMHHGAIAKALESVNDLARQPIPEELVRRFREVHDLPTDGYPDYPDWQAYGHDDALREFRRWRYEDALYRLATGNVGDSGLFWGPEKGRESRLGHPEQVVSIGDTGIARGVLAQADARMYEDGLCRQPLLTRTNTTVCWRSDLVKRPTGEGAEGGRQPFMVTISASVHGPDEWRAAQLIGAVLASSRRLGYDGVPLGRVLGGPGLDQAPPDVPRLGGAVTPRAVRNGQEPEDRGAPEGGPPLVAIAYGPDDIHTGIIAFDSLWHLNEFFRRLLSYRESHKILFTTVSVPLRRLDPVGDNPRLQTPRLLPPAPFEAEVVLNRVEEALKVVAQSKLTQGARDALEAGLSDLGMAARALLTNAEIASDADDLILALWDLPRTVHAVLRDDNPWGVVQLTKYLTLAVYEREQTLWAEAAPPGAPFHSEGVGLQQLAKGVAWLLGYIVNYALAPMPREARWPDAVLRFGRYRAGQVSIRRDELQEGDGGYRPRWTGCLCLTVLQGVYTARGGIVHFSDLFAQDVAVTLPRIFHEAGHLLWELMGFETQEQSERVLAACSGAPNEWMRGFGAARGPVLRMVEETFAHWVEFELFGRDRDFCIRSLWQNWLTSAYGARHPVDALRRTASIHLIAALLDRHKDAVAQAIHGERPEIGISRGEGADLVREAVDWTLGMATGGLPHNPPTPFGLTSPVFPSQWLREFGAAEHQYRATIIDTLTHVILPALRFLLVENWDVGLNLQCLSTQSRSVLFSAM